MYVLYQFYLSNMTLRLLANEIWLVTRLNWRSHLLPVESELTKPLKCCYIITTSLDHLFNDITGMHFNGYQGNYFGSLKFRQIASDCLWEFVQHHYLCIIQWFMLKRLMKWLYVIHTLIPFVLETGYLIYCPMQSLFYILLHQYHDLETELSGIVFFSGHSILYIAQTVYIWPL